MEQVQAVIHDFPAADVASPQGCAVGLEARVGAPHCEIVAEGVRAHGNVFSLVVQSFCNLSGHVITPMRGVYCLWPPFSFRTPGISAKCAGSSPRSRCTRLCPNL